ncbi:MAG TPA: nucleotide sugar dehydrogenase [candidate division Zixibacteria bacterium]|nr:nucleotide sugar dehydrogenase [candidate division Zixibacteria bacterium]
MRIAVVGLGHIGLPLAVQYARRGHQVTGCDVDARIVEAVNRGESPHRDEEALIRGVPEQVAAGRLRATTDDAEGVRGAEAVVVIVPVVVDERREIDFGPIDAATRDIARGLERGALVVYETTLPVGTTRDRLGPLLEEGSGLRAEADFHLAFSPERVLVGRVFEDLRRYPKIVGGIGPESTRRAVDFYRAVLDPGTEVRAVTNAETAEMTKLAETTYRDVNIALANEYARYAARRGIDVTEVIEAANSQPYSHIHQPGVGVGGHCIPVYPHFLFNTDPQLRLPPLARQINEGMAGWTVSQVRERLGALEGVPVLVLGIAYRADVREDAFSSAFRLRDELLAAGARVLGHDPYFDAEHLREMGFEPWDPERPEPVRVAVLQAGHRAYRSMDLARVPGLELVVDGRNALDRERVEAAGLAYAGIGR